MSLHNKKIIICLRGLIGSGKDLTATLIKFYDVYCRDSKQWQWDSTITELLESPRHISDVEKCSKWRTRGFADKLKEICALALNVSPRIFEDRNFKNNPLPECWNKVKPSVIPDWGGLELADTTKQMTGRDFLIGVGMALRSVHENFFVNALWNDEDWIAKGEKVINNDRFLVIKDVRFWNEYNSIKDRGGIMINIIRPGCINSGHQTETELEKATFDFTINNDSDKRNILKQLQPILIPLK